VPEVISLTDPVVMGVAIRFDVIGQRIDRILDYIHGPWVIEAATTVTIGKLPRA
jgi:hypothetical protein